MKTMFDKSRSVLSDFDYFIDSIINLIKDRDRSKLLLLQLLSRNTYASKNFLKIFSELRQCELNEAINRKMYFPGKGLMTAQLSFVVCKNFLVTLIKALTCYLCFRVIKPSQPKNIDLLFDGFIGQHDFNTEGIHVNRYYNEEITDRFGSGAFYFPVLASLYSPLEIIKFRIQFTSISDRCILAESYLSLWDIIQSLVESIHLPLAVAFDLRHSTDGLVRLARQCILNDIFHSEFFVALQRIRALRQLRESGYELKGCVVWYENIAVQKALIAGLRREFPECNISGYQGFVVPAFFACQIPSRLERQLNMCPDVIYHSYPEMIPGISELVEGLPIEVGPSRNSLNLFGEHSSHSRVVTVVMPYLDDDFLRLVEMSRYLSRHIDNSWNLVVKVHPAKEKFQLTYLWNLFRRCRNFGNVIFASTIDDKKLAFRASHVVSMSSTAVVDAFLAGRVTGVIGQRGCMWSDPLYHLADVSLGQMHYLIRTNADEASVQDFLRSSPLDYLGVEGYERPHTEDWLNTLKIKNHVRSRKAP